MEKFLAGFQWQVAVLYLDDVIVFGRSFDEHMQRLCLVLQRLHAANLKLKPQKCSLFRREVEFLGRVVSTEGVATDPDKFVLCGTGLNLLRSLTFEAFLAWCLITGGLSKALLKSLDLYTRLRRKAGH